MFINKNNIITIGKWISLVLISLFIVFCIKWYQNRNSEVKSFNSSIIVKKNTLPIIDFKLGNEKIPMILDTGSEISIIDDDVFNEHFEFFEILDTIKTNINTINGLEVNEMFKTSVYLNDSIQTELYVSNLDKLTEQIFISNGIMIEGIIGCDFLYKNKVIIDFKHKLVTNDCNHKDHIFQ